MARVSESVKNLMVDLSGYLLLFCVGCVAGTLNVIAGGGSFLTLPVMIFLGIPPSVANGTNRVGVVFQNVGAVWSFHRHGVMQWRYLLWAALPASCGAVLGAWGALQVSDQDFQRILALLMVAVTLWTLWDPLKARHSTADFSARPNEAAVLGVGFFLIGVYGGFVQAGVGFMILAVTTLAGLDLVRGNAREYLEFEDGKIADSQLRVELADYDMNMHAIGLTHFRSFEEKTAGIRSPAPLVMKYVGTEAEKVKSELLLAIMGSQGLGWEGEGFSPVEIDTVRLWAMSKGVTIAGGTSEVQLNLIAKNVLELPQS